MPRLLPFALLGLLASGCDPKALVNTDPFTGLTGITLEDPSVLAGTWGVVVELSTVLTLPVLGDRMAG